MTRFYPFLIMAFITLGSCGGGTGRKAEPKQAPTIKKEVLSESEKEQGYELYRSRCMNCHMPNGEGVKGFYPPLAGSDFLEKNRSKAIGMIKYGANVPIKVKGQHYHNLMPAAGLQDEELVLVINYVLNSWGNNFGKIDLEDLMNAQKIE